MVNMALLITVFLLLCYLDTTLAQIKTQIKTSQMCSTYVNRSICSQDSPTTASWCSYRNPYLVPRFLSSKDAARLEILSELASPVCDENHCFMFSRFFATTFRGRPLFVANVVTPDPDTNRLVALDGLTYTTFPGLAPGVQSGARYGDVVSSEKNTDEFIGGSLTVNPQKYYSHMVNGGVLTPDQIATTWAYRFSGVYINKPNDDILIPESNKHWSRFGYLTLFSDFVSVSSNAHSLHSASSTTGSLVDTEEGGWWIYPNAISTYVSLSKHTTFDIYRISFTPGHSSKVVDNVQIWEIDREPVSLQDQQNCPVTDLDSLQNKILNTPECKQNNLYPHAPQFFKTCPVTCAALFEKYLGNRKCYKHMFDLVRASKPSPTNVLVRAFIRNADLCIKHLPRVPKKLELNFVQQSYGCSIDKCSLRAGKSPFPEEGEEEEKANQKCGGRTRTLVTLVTETTVSILQYDPPDSVAKPVKIVECNLKSSRCDPPAKEEDCPAPCVHGEQIKSVAGNTDFYKEWWMGLGRRVVKISVEDTLLSHQQQCSSCNSSSSNNNKNAKTNDDAPGCILFPTKVYKDEQIDSVSIFGAKLHSENEQHGVDSLMSTQQIWMVAAVSRKNQGMSMLVFELPQFGNMSVSTAPTTCNPVGNVANNLQIPIHTPPIPLKQNDVSILHDVHVKQTSYAYQTLPKELEALLENENCTCALNDLRCHVTEAEKNAKEKGKSFDPSKLSEISKIDQLEQHTHIVQASTSDRRLIVIYLSEIYGQCISAAAATGNARISIVQSPTLFSNGVIAEIVNEVPLAGTAQFIDFTHNAQFSMITMTRLKSEINAMERAAELCSLWEKNPNDPFLISLASTCDLNNPMRPRKPSILDFVQVASFCVPGSYCPSFTDYNLSAMSAGYYSTYGYDKNECEAGSFCPQGVKQTCPIGSTCPNVGMKTPFPCKIDSSSTTSCFANGLQKPQECKSGTVCYTPYMPGLPAPPGTKTSATGIIPRTLIHCKVGEYCSLGRSENEDTNCPAGTFCMEPNVTLPTICAGPDAACLAKHCPETLSCPEKCAGMTSCPEGSFVEKNCSAGEFCPDPRSHGINCSDTSYCPIGTFSIPPPCPPGYFCTTPKEKLICPISMFCPSGSITPQPCGWLDWCPVGSSEKRAGVFGLIFVIILPFLLMGISTYIYKERDRKRQTREEARKLRKLSVTTSGLRGSELKDGELRQQSYTSSTNSRGSDLEMSPAGFLSLPLSDTLLGEHNSNMERIDAIDDVLRPREFRVDFSFDNLGLNIKGTGKSVLDGVTGEIKSSHVTAGMFSFSRNNTIYYF